MTHPEGMQPIPVESERPVAVPVGEGEFTLALPVFEGPLQLLLHQFQSPLIYILLAATLRIADVNGGIGPGLLARRVQPALLEARDNLPAAYVLVAVRQGIGNMPPVPRGEVSDEELRQIADYLAAGPHEAAQ